MLYLEQKYSTAKQAKHEYYVALYRSADFMWDNPEASLESIRHEIYMQTKDYYLQKGNLDELLTCARDGLPYHGPNGWIKPIK